MNTLPSTVLTIIPSDKIPEWIAGAPARHLQQIIQFACVSAGVSGQARLRYLSEKDVLKKKNLPASSLVLQNSSRYYGVDTLTLIVTGKDARNHKVRCTLTMDSAQCEKFAQYITDLPEHMFVLTTLRNPVLPPGLPLLPSVSTTDVPFGAAQPVCRPASPPPPGPPDDDTLALFLDAVRDAGSTITKATAESISRKLIGDTTLVTAALQAEYLAARATPDLYFITIAGDALLRQKIDSPASDATKPVVSDFDRLKSAVRDARAQHQAAQAMHDARAQARTTLTHQLTEAREAYQSEELNATTLQGRLQKLQQDLLQSQGKMKCARQRVLDLEEQSRLLGTDTPDLIQAERTLKDAEAAYQQLIAL